MMDFPELKFSVVNGYCDIILLPFQGVYCLLLSLFTQGAAPLALGYVRSTFALSGRL